MTEKPDLEKNAVKSLTQIVDKYGFKPLLDSRKNKTHSERQNYKVIIDQLPDFDIDSDLPTQFLVDVGIWSDNPKNFEQMLESPRYFAGRRQVLVKHYVQSAVPNQKDKFMKLCKKEQA